MAIDERYFYAAHGLDIEKARQYKTGWDTYRERCVFVQYIDGHFQITGRNESFNIVAWMPLPEAYKAESEDE